MYASYHKSRNTCRKYEEIYPPEVGEFVYITDDTYTKKQVLRMEHLVLKVLNFDLAVPSALTFANLFCKMSESEERTAHLAQYLCELTLMDGETYLVRLALNGLYITCLCVKFAIGGDSSAWYMYVYGVA